LRTTTSTSLVLRGIIGENYFIVEGTYYNCVPILGALQVRITTTGPILGGMTGEDYNIVLLVQSL
jgi:hypothetical protein